MKRKYKKTDVGVLVGRFQVDNLHEAHIKLIKGVVDEHEKVIIFLGLSPARVTRNNPLDFESRKQMILDEFPDVNILYIKDNPSDEAWSKNLDEQIADLVGPTSTVTLYGGRESFIRLYHGKYPTCELEQESYVSGSEIRQKVSKKVKSSPEFRAGVIWGAYNQYPKAIPTVDIAIWNDKSDSLLLARKKDEELYRFIGGFAQNGPYEVEARREVSEEAHIEISDPQYLGSHVVDDWRYRREVDKIVTMLFEAKHVFGKPTPDDDIYELRWFEVKKIKEEDLVKEHRPLLKMLLEKSVLKDQIIIAEDKIDKQEEEEAWKRFNEKEIERHAAESGLRNLSKSKKVLKKLSDKNTDVHTEHCCKDCGCKYNDEDCTVVTGLKPQTFKCGTLEVCEGFLQ